MDRVYKFPESREVMVTPNGRMFTEQFKYEVRQDGSVVYTYAIKECERMKKAALEGGEQEGLEIIKAGRYSLARID